MPRDFPDAPRKAAEDSPTLSRKFCRIIGLRGTKGPLFPRRFRPDKLAVFASQGIRCATMFCGVKRALLIAALACGAGAIPARAASDSGSDPNDVPGLIKALS